MIKRYAVIREDINDYQTRIEEYIQKDKWRDALDVAKSLLKKYNIDYNIEDIVLSCDFSDVEIETMASSDDGATLYCAGTAYKVYPGFENIEEEYVLELFERATKLDISRAMFHLPRFFGNNIEIYAEIFVKIANQGCIDAYLWAAGYLHANAHTLLIPPLHTPDLYFRAAWYYREAYLYGYDTKDIRTYFHNYTKETISLYRPGLLPFSWIPQEYQTRVITTLLVMKRLWMPSYVRMVICDYVCS